MLDDNHNEEGFGVADERSMSQQKELPPSYMNDFALPGPTVAMFGAALDSFACSVAILSTEMDSAAMVQDTLDTANHRHEIVMLRNHHRRR